MIESFHWMDKTVLKQSKHVVFLNICSQLGWKLPRMLLQFIQLDVEIVSVI